MPRVSSSGLFINALLTLIGRKKVRRPIYRRYIDRYIEEYWIGLAWDTDHFEWVSTGETLSWNAWETGKPWSPETNQFVALQTNRTWDNLIGSTWLSYICEIGDSAAGEFLSHLCFRFNKGIRHGLERTIPGIL